MTRVSMTLLALAFAAQTADAQVPPPPPPTPIPAETPPTRRPAPLPPTPFVPAIPPPLGWPAILSPLDQLPTPLPPLPPDFEYRMGELQAKLADAKIFEFPDWTHNVDFDFKHNFDLDFNFDWAHEQTPVIAARARENSYYDRGRNALDRRNWQDAINRFEQVVQLKGARADAAMYWKAYAQGKLGQRAEALATIDALVKGYPQSRYLNDAKALEIELKSRTGPVSPESQQDEDLKLLAIQGLQHSDPEQAIPLLEKIINSAHGPRLKERALYVLALSNTPRAREILLGIAKGGGNPDLQRKAIDYLATHSRREGSSSLEAVYRANPDPDVRARVLRAYASAGDRARLLAVAQTEPNEELRLQAITYLGSAGAITELSQLYDKETSKAIRLRIVRSLASAGAIERLQQIARGETEQEIRLQAIRSFASAGRERTGTILQDMYAKETAPEVKRAIIQALHSQQNAEGLVAVARRETDPKLKEDIVRRLSTMTKSKAALDYLMELLK